MRGDSAWIAIEDLQCTLPNLDYWRRPCVDAELVEYRGVLMMAIPDA